MHRKPLYRNFNFLQTGSHTEAWKVDIYTKSARMFGKVAINQDQRILRTKQFVHRMGWGMGQPIIIIIIINSLLALKVRVPEQGSSYVHLNHIQK